MAPRLLVLDLDGTLVDSVPDLAASLARLFARRGLAAYAPAELVPMIGDGARVLLARAFAGRGLPLDEAALAEFLEDYGAHAAEATRPYPGVPETLDRLSQAGWRLAVCTNKPEAPARALLAALGLAERFAAIGGGDSFPTCKPDPAHLLATIAAAGGEPARSVMAGDHGNDIAAACGAGLPSIFAAWGYGPPAMAAGAAAIAQSFADLPGLADGLVPAS
jgi:phosphoglycolate phosphatase